MNTRTEIHHDPKELPDTIPVQMPDGKIYEGTVSGKATRWPVVWFTYHGAKVQAEYAPETLMHIAETGHVAKW